MNRSWYYSKDRTNREGPVSTDELRARFLQGDLPPETVVWSQGMTDWAPITAHPELQSAEAPPPAMPTPPPQPAAPGAAPTGRVPPSFGGWLRFVGIASIVMGILYCASCFGILWGVLLIIGGAALLSARTALDRITEVPPSFEPFLQKLNTFFIVTGIAYLIMLVGAALVLIFYSGFMIAALSNLS